MKHSGEQGAAVVVAGVYNHPMQAALKEKNRGALAARWNGSKRRRNPMTLAQIEQRLTVLERAVEDLRAEMNRSPAALNRWWRDYAGRFKNDPVFEEVVRLGREYRESLRPGHRRRSRKRS
jgi:uncharacterized protein YukE